MYERFTDRARKVMQFANQEALRLNHEYIGTEHILLGLIKEGSGVAANVLKNLGADLGKVRMEVEKLLQKGPDMVTMGKLPKTPRAKRVIEYSMEEARISRHDYYVGSEHILLGLLREQEGVGPQVLMNLGLKLEAVREEILNLLGHGMDEPDEGVPSPGKSAFQPNALAFAAPFKDHPLVHALIQVYLAYTAERDEQVAAQDFEKAAAALDAAGQVKRQLRTLCSLLKEDPNLGQLAPEQVSRYCLPLPWPECRPARPEQARFILDCLCARRSVLLVGEIGSGRRTLAQFVAKEVFHDTARRAPFPWRLVAPNHRAIQESEAGWVATLLSLVDHLSEREGHLIVLPEIDRCCDPMPSAPQACEAWKHFLAALFDRGSPVLAWSTPDGVQSLASTWPGVAAHFERVDLPDLPEATLREVLQDELARVSEARRLAVEDGFVAALLASRSRWNPGSPMAEPGRTLALFRAILEFDPAAPGPSPGRTQDPGMEEFLHTKDELQRAIAANRLARATSLMRELKKRQRRLSKRATPSSPVPRALASSDIEAFLRSQNGPDA